LKSDRLSSLQEHSTEPQALAPRLVQQKLSPYPKGDVRAYLSFPEEIEAIEKLDRKTLKRIYDEFIGASVGELAIVGDFDEAAATAAAEKMLKGWKSGQPYERIARTDEKAPPPEMIRVNIPDKANAMYFAGLMFPMRDDDSDYPALIVGNDVLGGSGFASRLMSRIREKEGLCYGVGSGFRSMSLDKRSTISLYAISNPQNIDRVVTLAREECERLLKNGVTEDELAESKRGYLQSQQAGRSDDSKLAQLLVDCLYVGRTLQFQAGVEERVEKLTRDQVDQAMRKHLDPSRLVNAVVGDLPTKAK
jgi:zinc protease